MGRRRKRKGKASTGKESPLAAFAEWWKNTPNSWKCKPDLRPDRRFEVEYLNFLHAFHERWKSDHIQVLRELIERASAEEMQVRDVLSEFERWFRRVVLDFVQSDLAEAAATPSEYELHPLRRGGPFRRHVGRWIRGVRAFFGSLASFPLVVPLSVAFGCDPRRQDLLPGVATFGFWSSRAMPWNDPQNLALEDLGGGKIRIDLPLAERLSKDLAQKWLVRAGAGPERWHEYLKTESTRPVWVAWVLFRLTSSWDVTEPSEHQNLFLQAHLLAASAGYRAALRTSFDPSREYRDGDARLADVFPVLDLGNLGPDSWVGPDGVQEASRLHKLCSFLWYACELISGQVGRRQPRRVRKNRAWIDQALDYIYAHPGCTLSAIADHADVAVSTVSRNQRVRRAMQVYVMEPKQGHRNSDRTLDAVVYDDE